jgi:predicted amidophosphoribosyltransferase
VCKTCCNPDGTLNTDYLEDNASCCFGCNHKVDKDYRVCPECKDHSHNVVECEECHAEYDDVLDGLWEVTNFRFTYNPALDK